MNKMLMLQVLAMAVLVNSAAVAQNKLEYNPFQRDTADVSKIEQQWANAVLARDTATLQTLLGDDYTLVGPDGKTLNKAAELAMIQSEEFKLDSLTLQDLKVRVYTGGAVVTGRAVVKGKSKDKDISGDYMFMDVFEPRNNTWRAVASQLTKVEEEQGAGKEKKK